MGRMLHSKLLLVLGLFLFLGSLQSSGRVEATLEDFLGLNKLVNPVEPVDNSLDKPDVKDSLLDKSAVDDSLLDDKLNVDKELLDKKKDPMDPHAMPMVITFVTPTPTTTTPPPTTTTRYIPPRFTPKC